MCYTISIEKTLVSYTILSLNATGNKNLKKHIQWNLSNLIHQESRKKCPNIQVLYYLTEILFYHIFFVGCHRMSENSQCWIAQVPLIIIWFLVVKVWILAWTILQSITHDSSVHKNTHDSLDFKMVNTVKPVHMVTFIQWSPGLRSIS